ncbi:MAG: hypothetical protein D6785_16245, partial [Planctomycetota bacterium]
SLWKKLYFQPWIVWTLRLGREKQFFVHSGRKAPPLLGYWQGKWFPIYTLKDVNKLLYPFR